MSLAKKMLDKEIEHSKTRLKKSLRFNATWCLSLIVINIALAIPAVIDSNFDSLFVPIISIVWLLIIWPLWNQIDELRCALNIHHAKDFFEKIEEVEDLMDKEIENVLKDIASRAKVPNKKRNQRTAKSGTRPVVSSKDDKATRKPVAKSK